MSRAFPPSSLAWCDVFLVGCLFCILSSKHRILQSTFSDGKILHVHWSNGTGKGILCCYLICPTLKRTVGTTPSPLGAAVSSSLLVGTVVSRLLWAIVRGEHQRLFFWLIIKWRTDKRLSSDPSCGTESMRRLSGRINRRTSLCLQSFMALCCLCSGGGRGGGGEKMKRPVQHRRKAWAIVAQKTTLTLERRAGRLSVLSGCAALPRLVSSDHAYSSAPHLRPIIIFLFPQGWWL